MYSNCTENIKIYFLEAFRVDWMHHNANLRIRVVGRLYIYIYRYKGFINVYGKDALRMREKKNMYFRDTSTQSLLRRISATEPLFSLEVAFLPQPWRHYTVCRSPCWSAPMWSWRNPRGCTCRRPWPCTRSSSCPTFSSPEVRLSGRAKLTPPLAAWEERLLCVSAFHQKLICSLCKARLEHLICIHKTSC